MSEDIALKEFMRANGDQFTHTIQRAYELGKAAGITIGEEAARERVLRALGGEVAPMRAPAPMPEPVGAPASAQAPSKSPGATQKGSIIEPVRRALRAMEIGTTGVGPLDVQKFISRTSGVTLDANQVRAALKMLARKHEVVRLRRGRYRAKEQAPTPPRPLLTLYSEGLRLTHGGELTCSAAPIAVNGGTMIARV